MPRLLLHNNPVETVFDLLGTKENDLSYSLGWVLAQCPPLINEVVRALTGRTVDAAKVEGLEIRLQEHNRKDGGYSDLELIVPGHCYLIIEMKRGWNLPGPVQLARYAQRPGMVDPAFPDRRLVTFSECSAEYAHHFCPVEDFTVAPLAHYNWPDLMKAIGRARSHCGHTQKRLLDEFRTYLKRAVTMRSIDTNQVWVVALTDDIMPGWTISFKDVVDDHRKYFQKISKGNPATYIAFKYRSKLHSIHFVEKCEVIMDACPIFDQPNGRPFPEPHYLFTLGPPIRPAHEVRYGKIYNPGRAYCMLDTLLTCSTIEEAIKETKRREEAYA